MRQFLIPNLNEVLLYHALDGAVFSNQLDAGPVDTFLGIAENNAIDFKVYPNPAQNEMNVGNQQGLVSIADMSGKVLLVQKANNETIDNSALSSGTYLVSIDHNGKSGKQLLIKQ